MATISTRPARSSRRIDAARQSQRLHHRLGQPLEHLREVERRGGQPDALVQAGDLVLAPAQPPRDRHRADGHRVRRAGEESEHGRHVAGVRPSRGRDPDERDVRQPAEVLRQGHAADQHRRQRHVQVPAVVRQQERGDRDVEQVEEDGGALDAAGVVDQNRRRHPVGADLHPREPLPHDQGVAAGRPGNRRGARWKTALYERMPPPTSSSGTCGTARPAAPAASVAARSPAAAIHRRRISHARLLDSSWSATVSASCGGRRLHVPAPRATARAAIRLLRATV